MARSTRIRAAGLAVTVICLLTASSASADILILDSNVPRIKRGATLSDGDRLRVPAGKSVMIMRPSGETQEVTGPYDRLVRDIAAGETISETFRNMRQQLENEVTGGAIGGTRAIPK